MGMTEYEKRMVELEKKKVKLLTDILKELDYMNKSDFDKAFVSRDDEKYVSGPLTEATCETSESI